MAQTDQENGESEQRENYFNRVSYAVREVLQGGREQFMLMTAS